MSEKDSYTGHVLSNESVCALVDCILDGENPSDDIIFGSITALKILAARREAIASEVFDPLGPCLPGMGQLEGKDMGRQR